MGREGLSTTKKSALCLSAALWPAVFGLLDSLLEYEDWPASWRDKMDTEYSEDPIPHYAACEKIRIGRFILAPMNTWSNVAFGVSGTLMLYYYLREVKSYRKRQFLLLFPFLTWLLTLSSATYHASLTNIGGFLESTTTLIIGTYLFIFNVFLIVQFYKPDATLLFPFGAFFLLSAWLITDVFLGWYLPRVNEQSNGFESIWVSGGVHSGYGRVFGAVAASALCVVAVYRTCNILWCTLFGILLPLGGIYMAVLDNSGNCLTGGEQGYNSDVLQGVAVGHVLEALGLLTINIVYRDAYRVLALQDPRLNRIGYGSDETFDPKPGRTYWGYQNMRTQNLNLEV